MQRTQWMFTWIPGNLLEHSREYYFGDCSKNYGECSRRVWICSRRFLRVFKTISVNFWQRFWVFWNVIGYRLSLFFLFLHWGKILITVNGLITVRKIRRLNKNFKWSQFRALKNPLDWMKAIILKLEDKHSRQI